MKRLWHIEKYLATSLRMQNNSGKFYPYRNGVLVLIIDSTPEQK